MVINRSVVTVLSFSAILAGCSGGGGGGSQASAPSPTIAPTATPTPTPTPTPTVAPTATPTASPTAKPTATPVPTGPVTANVSGSTNVAAYTVVLQQNASATLTQDNFIDTTTISTSDTAQYFKDLNTYSPISNVTTLPTCAKSASLGTTTVLNYDGSTSGDVSCPPSTGTPAETLYQDELKIEADMKANIGPFTH